MLHRSNAECTVMVITITIRNVTGCKSGGHGQARAEAAGRGGIDPGRASGPLPGGVAGGHARRALPQAGGPAQPPAAVEGRRGRAGRAAGGRGATRAEQTSNAYELVLPDRPVASREARRCSATRCRPDCDRQPTGETPSQFVLRGLPELTEAERLRLRAIQEARWAGFNAEWQARRAKRWHGRG